MKSILLIVVLMSGSLSAGALRQTQAQPTELAFMPSVAEVQVQGRAFEEQGMKVMSYNLRLDVASDGENAWPERKEFLVSQLAFHAPDIIGTQEGLPHQLDWLSGRLSSYGRVGEGRDGGDAGEYSAIFYQRDRLRVEASGTFWLSETPDRPSKGWDTAIQRICSWARFSDRRSGKSFYCFNTHLDHRGAISRAKGLELILQIADSLNTEQLPYILTGDLNLTPDAEPIRSLSQKMTDAFHAATIRLGPVGTFTGFNYDEPAERRIDYIFVSASPRVEVLRFATLTDAVKRRYPSDHFAVMAYLLL